MKADIIIYRVWNFILDCKTFTSSVLALAQQNKIEVNESRFFKVETRLKQAKTSKISNIWNRKIILNLNSSNNLNTYYLFQKCI